MEIQSSCSSRQINSACDFSYELPDPIEGNEAEQQIGPFDSRNSLGYPAQLNGGEQWGQM